MHVLLYYFLTMCYISPFVGLNLSHFNIIILMIQFIILKVLSAAADPRTICVSGTARDHCQRGSPQDSFPPEARRALVRTAGPKYRGTPETENASPCVHRSRSDDSRHGPG